MIRWRCIYCQTQKPLYHQMLICQTFDLALRNIVKIEMKSSLKINTGS